MVVVVEPAARRRRRAAAGGGLRARRRGRRVPHRDGGAASATQAVPVATRRSNSQPANAAACSPYVASSGKKWRKAGSADEARPPCRRRARGPHVRPDRCGPHGGGQPSRSGRRGSGRCAQHLMPRSTPAIRPGPGARRIPGGSTRPAVHGAGTTTRQQDLHPVGSRREHQDPRLRAPAQVVRLHRGLAAAHHDRPSSSTAASTGDTAASRPPAWSPGRHGDGYGRSRGPGPGPRRHAPAPGVPVTAMARPYRAPASRHPERSGRGALTLVSCRRNGGRRGTPRCSVGRNAARCSARSPTATPSSASPTVPPPGHRQAARPRIDRATASCRARPSAWHHRWGRSSTTAVHGVRRSAGRRACRSGVAAPGERADTGSSAVRDGDEVEYVEVLNGTLPQSRTASGHGCRQRGRPRAACCSMRWRRRRWRAARSPTPRALGVVPRAGRGSIRRAGRAASPRDAIAAR